MINKNEILSQIDAHVKSSYNVLVDEQVASVEVDNKIIYFRNGLPFVEFDIDVQITHGGPQIVVGEFSFDKKLKE